MQFTIDTIFSVAEESVRRSSNDRERMKAVQGLIMGFKYVSRGMHSEVPHAADTIIDFLESCSFPDGEVVVPQEPSSVDSEVEDEESDEYQDLNPELKAEHQRADKEWDNNSSTWIDSVETINVGGREVELVPTEEN